MSVIGHEYGHMIENRMIGKGFAPQGEHAGAMGEAFGDLNAPQYLNENHYAPVSGINPFDRGCLRDRQPVNGIRDFCDELADERRFPRARAKSA